MKHITRRAGALGALAITALFATGCKKDEKAEAAPAAKKVEAKAEGGCSEKAFKHTNPNFCIDVPDGYAPKPEKTDVGGGVSQAFLRADDYGFTLNWNGAGKPEDVLEYMRTPQDGEAIVEEMELPGGYAKYTVYKEAGSDDYYFVAGGVKGAKAFVSCGGQTPKKDVADALMKACKSLRVE